MTTGFQYLAEKLDRAAQEALLMEVHALVQAAPLYVPRMPRTGKAMSVRMTNAGPLGWVTDKAWITGGAVITTDKALFNIADYEGQITADLFGEHGVFADPETFWKAQSAAVAQRVEAYIAEGWKDVICLERGAFFHRWDHQTRTKKQGGKVYVELRHDGTVTFHEGYISQAEARRQEASRLKIL
jgi:hypothetical protein